MKSKSTTTRNSSSSSSSHDRRTRQNTRQVGIMGKQSWAWMKVWVIVVVLCMISGVGAQVVRIDPLDEEDSGVSPSAQGGLSRGSRTGRGGTVVPESGSESENEEEGGGGVVGTEEEEEEVPNEDGLIPPVSTDDESDVTSEDEVDRGEDPPGSSSDTGSGGGQQRANVVQQSPSASGRSGSGSGPSESGSGVGRSGSSSSPVTSTGQRLPASGSNRGGSRSPTSIGTGHSPSETTPTKNGPGSHLAGPNNSTNPTNGGDHDHADGEQEQKSQLQAMWEGKQFPFNAGGWTLMISLVAVPILAFTLIKWIRFRRNRHHRQSSANSENPLDAFLRQEQGGSGGGLETPAFSPGGESARMGNAPILPPPPVMLSSPRLPQVGRGNMERYSQVFSSYDHPPPESYYRQPKQQQQEYHRQQTGQTMRPFNAEDRVQSYWVGDGEVDELSPSDSQYRDGGSDGEDDDGAGFDRGDRIVSMFDRDRYALNSVYSRYPAS